MNSEGVTLRLSTDEALVLYDVLARWENSSILTLRDAAEEAAALAVSRELDRNLSEPFVRDYAVLLSTARMRLAERQGPMLDASDAASEEAGGATELVEVFGRDTNAWVIRTPGRHHPALVLQGDTFSSLHNLADSILRRVRQCACEDAELVDEAEELVELLHDRLEHYHKVVGPPSAPEGGT